MIAHQCPVEGCQTTAATDYYLYSWKGGHARMQHYRCGCGWVGVRPRSHVAMRKRLGDDVSRCCSTPPVELPLWKGQVPVAGTRRGPDNLVCPRCRASIASGGGFTAFTKRTVTVDLRIDGVGTQGSLLCYENWSEIEKDASWLRIECESCDHHWLSRRPFTITGGRS